MPVMVYVFGHLVLPADGTILEAVDSLGGRA